MTFAYHTTFGAMLTGTGGAWRATLRSSHANDVQMYRVHPSSQPLIGMLRGQAYLGMPVSFGTPP